MAVFRAIIYPNKNITQSFAPRDLSFLGGGGGRGVIRCSFYGIGKKISEIIRLIGFSVVFLPKLTNPYVGGVSPKKEPLKKKKNEGQLYYPGVLREGLWY